MHIAGVFPYPAVGGFAASRGNHRPAESAAEMILAKLGETSLLLPQDYDCDKIASVNSWMSSPFASPSAFRSAISITSSG